MELLCRNTSYIHHWKVNHRYTMFTQLKNVSFVPHFKFNSHGYIFEELFKWLLFLLFFQFIFCFIPHHGLDIIDRLTPSI